MMGAKDSGFILQESHNAVMEEMSGHVSINSRKRIIEEIHFFVLDKKKKHQEDLGQCDPLASTAELVSTN